MNMVYLIVALIAILIAISFKIYNISKLSKEQQLEMLLSNLQEWLKYGVTISERELGSGTGQLKLRLVYNMAVDKFPMLINVISFNQFSDMVDKALEWLDNQLKENKNTQNYVQGE